MLQCTQMHIAVLWCQFKLYQQNVNPFQSVSLNLYQKGLGIRLGLITIEMNQCYCSFDATMMQCSTFDCNSLFCVLLRLSTRLGRYASGKLHIWEATHLGSYTSGKLHIWEATHLGSNSWRLCCAGGENKGDFVWRYVPSKKEQAIGKHCPGEGCKLSNPEAYFAQYVSY